MKSNIIKKEHVVLCDVDETLIMHVDLQTAVTSPDRVDIYDAVEDKHIFVIRNNPMIRLVKEEVARGSYVIVWSRGGYAWAASVVEALGLDKLVHQVMSKPMVYFDDKPIEQWLPYRVYLTPETIYKPNSTKE